MPASYISGASHFRKSGDPSAHEDAGREQERLTPDAPAGKPLKMRSVPAIAILLACIALATPLASTAQTAPAALKIDVPVVLKDARIILNMDHLAFADSTPVGLIWMKRIADHLTHERTPWQIVAIFHGPAGYMVLGDAAYDRARKSTAGNPYKPLIAELQKAGVRFEECGNTAHDMGWTNADFLPGVLVNTGANFRIVQLVQEGFVQLQP